MNVNPHREMIMRHLSEMQKNPHIQCDILTNTEFMNDQKLLDHAEAYLDYIRRAEIGVDEYDC